MTGSIARSLALAALAGAVAAPAYAQGGLLGKIRDKVDPSKSVRGEQPESRAAKRRAAPAFNDEVLEITDAHINQMLKGLAAEQAELQRVAAANAAAAQQNAAEERAYEAKQQEYERQMAVFRPKAEAYQKCMMEAQGAVLSAQQDPAVASVNQKMASMSEADQQRLQKRMEELQKRMQAAQARGDRAAQAALADTAMREMERMTGVSMGEMQRAGQKASQAAMAGPQKCGPEPTAPVEPKRMRRDTRDSLQAASVAGLKASGLEARQYSIMRERLLAYVTLGDKAGTTLYAYSDAELEALKSRMADLKRYEAHMREHSVSTWTMGDEGDE
jgi:hypothetical protein